MDILTTYTTRTTSNYSATANLQNSQIIKTPAKFFPVCCVFISCSLATASNSGDLSASSAQVLYLQPPVPNNTNKSESESHITIDGQSASPSWNKAPIWGLRPDFYYCQPVASLLMWGFLSDERTGLTFIVAAGSRHRTHSRVRVPWDSRPYFTVSDSRLPFSSPSTTRRATVETFDPAESTSKSKSKSKSKLCYDRQFSRSVGLGMKHPSGA
jgi:hypothetical protein